MTNSDAVNAAGPAQIAWRKSSFSGPDGHCVECATLSGGMIAVRNSNRPEAGTLLFTHAEMSAWILGCRAGEFDDLV
ncbi:DUF397 domain-containing protein [Nocardia sp. NEAU-G5]|uniref:DUF397 domain-containing protein n=1 Tax=Nocardia albiluteola TaxID=2842303 RepID=A0ABS6B4N5_9NOCA|nr:DUF397 domain-containing protein [Nocardia albiluteola]MBU3065256.1 DUF397 domain-containing protein [Nocardia albiluteola]